MKFNLNDFVTVKLTKKGKLIYYQKALESKQKYVERLKKWNNWQSISKQKPKEYTEITSYLNKKSDKYFEQKIAGLQEDGTITIPFTQLINIFGSSLFFEKRAKVLKEKMIIDVNSSTRKLFPPEENKVLEIISLQDQISLRLTEYGASLLRERDYKGQINDNNEVLLTVFNMIKYLYQDTDTYHAQIAQEVSTIPKQKNSKFHILVRKIS